METAKVLLPPPPVGKVSRPSVAEQTPLETPFLFVNETTASPAFKHGGRQDIRSHVRKHVAKRFRQNHKTGKAVREEEGQVMRYPAIVPQGFASSYNHDCDHDHGHELLLELRQPGLNLSLAIPIENSFIEAKESSTSASAAPTRDEQFDSDFMPLTVADYNAPVPSGLQDDSKLKDLPRFFCPTCGSHISSAKRDAIERRGAIAIVRRIFNRAIFNGSPIEALASGRVDPFLSYPVDKPTPQLHELIDHAITYLLPGLVPDGPSSAANPVSKAWLSTGLEHPLVFHALVFAGSIHLDFLRSSKIFPNSPQALSHKLIVIQKLKEIMREPTKACRDEVILAILVLSSHETQDQSQVRRSPFNSPLKSAQWLSIYGNFTYVPEHMQAVLDLITMRGGLEKLELHGLAETIAAGDVLSSTQNLTKPVLPPLRISEYWMETLMNWVTAPPRSPMLKLGCGFRDLEGYCITENMMYILGAIAALTISIEHYIEGEPAGLSLGALARTRTAVQYRLMSLPSFTELEQTSLRDPQLYEACRLTAIIYGVAVVYPIPNSYMVFQQLVEFLKDSVKTGDIKQFEIGHPDFLLWMLMLGAIASFEKPERPWFIAQLAMLAKTMEMDEWQIVGEKLSLFLWLESACGSGGQKVWSEVMKRLHSQDFGE